MKKKRSKKVANKGPIQARRSEVIQLSMAALSALIQKAPMILAGENDAVTQKHAAEQHIAISNGAAAYALLTIDAINRMERTK